MEQVGKTTDGGYLVKFTDAEWLELQRLQTVANGEPVEMTGFYARVDGAALTPTFKAIRLWLECQMRLDALEGLARAGRRILGMPEQEQPERS